MKKPTTIFAFFKRKASNDLEANTSGATLPTTNVEEVPIEENLDITIEGNSQTKFQKVDMSLLQLQRDLDGVGKYILIMLINKMRFGDVTLSWVHTNLVLKKNLNLKRVEAFKVLGMNMIALSRGLNILLKKMLFFCLYFCP